MLHPEKPVRRLARRTFRLEGKQFSLVRERGIDRRRPVRTMNGEQVERIFFEKHEWILLGNKQVEMNDSDRSVQASDADPPFSLPGKNGTQEDAPLL